MTWHLECVNQDRLRCHCWDLSRQPTEGFVHLGYLWVDQLARAGWTTYKVLLALLGLGTWTIIFGRRRDLEVPASEHPTGSANEVCVVDWRQAVVLQEHCLQPLLEKLLPGFFQTPTLPALLSLMLGKMVHSPSAIEKSLGGHQASGSGGLSMLSQSCQHKCFITWSSTKPH